MSGFNFSYSTIEDVYATAQDESGDVKAEMLKLAEDLEQTGIGYYDGQEYIIRDTDYGREIVSMADFQSESEDDDEDEE